MIYEFITPSDPITFLAPDDAVAFCVTLSLGRGKAFCKGEDGHDVQTFCAFSGEKETKALIEKNLGGAYADFIVNRWEDVATAFESFAYGHFSDRQQYDDAVAAITDPAKLEEFKAKHDDRRRSSMSEWVKGAWELGHRLRQNKEAARGPQAEVAR